MNKREIIMIVIAVAIGLFGLLDFLIFSKSNPSDQTALIKIEKNKVNDFAITAQAQLQIIQKVTRDSNLPYWIHQAESSWVNDPFINYDLTTQTNSQTEKRAVQNIPELDYTGFVQAGDKLMAIVNGMEYMVGEIIKEIGYKVLSITPTRVKLLTDENKKIILSIEGN